MRVRRGESEQGNLVEKTEGRAKGMFVEGRLPFNPKHEESVVFVHGSGMNYLSGEPVIDTFSRDFGYRGFSFSLPGHTKSEVPADFAKYGLEDYYRCVDDLSQYLQTDFEVAPEQQIICGHSMGGLLAMQRAKDATPAALILMNSGFPKGLIDKLGLSEMYPGETEEDIEAMRQGVEKGEIVVKKVAKVRAYFGDRLPADFDEAFARKYAKLLSQESNQARLDIITHPPEVVKADIKCPILVVGARNDTAMLYKNAERLAEFLGADLLDTNASHMSMFDDDWPDTAARINKWLSEKVVGK